jgi:hypothetical protein
MSHYNFKELAKSEALEPRVYSKAGSRHEGL